MSKGIKVINYSKNPKEFLEYLGNIPEDKGIITPTSFTLDNDYENNYHGESFINFSHFIVNDDVVLGLVLAHAYDNHIRYNNSGIELHIFGSSKLVLKESLSYLEDCAKAHGIEFLLIADSSTLPHLSNIGEFAFNMNGSPSLKLNAAVDLTEDETTLHKNLRKSYKSLINSGRKNMKFFKYDSQTIDEKLFISFQNFHKKVAGKATRSQKTWDIQLETIKKDCAELIMAYKEPHGLVSAALFEDRGDTTIYSVAVYDRELFDYPLAHSNVYEGILSAKERGQKKFYLGEIPPYNKVTEKEFNIGKFKKGFVDTLTTQIEWKISIK